MYRLFTDKMTKNELDEAGMFRLDDWELQDNVQSKVAAVWDKVTTDNIQEYGDIDGYWEDFYNMFGFHYDNVDYEADVEA